tara:strand:- start:302 stop:1258 length:957 start_codon:yes stop_codon:yes gene_type:complete
MNIFDKVLFSITREDYQVEYQTIIKRGYKNILTVCSGGCTPLSLNALLHDVKITAFDINPHQINLLDKKLRLANNKDFDNLSVDVKNDKTINQSGQFEAMFLRFRNIFEKYVSTKNEIEQLFNPRLSKKKQDKIIVSWLKNPNIKVPFEKVFNDNSIELVFSSKATQHAKPSSYINYFFHKIMSSFKKQNFQKNPFLQHIFLGYYKKENVPDYIITSKKLNVETFVGTLYEIPNLENYDLVSLSNLFDWSDEKSIKKSTMFLSKLSSGSGVILRQLNNNKDWSLFFNNSFYEDPLFNNYWRKNDRSMFYDNFRLYIKK